ncbi:MAG: PQQ-dependent sugar dehydrogenase [Porticoccaceae bacterium]|jgi:aldose sugar dehydrogenase|nr:PQQ-dependent sugar dehydrogenase [Porticoccaceae bacterium]
MLKVGKSVLTPIKLAGLMLGLSTIANAQSSDFEVRVLGQYDVPWALEFLPDDRLLLSEMPGALKLLDEEGQLLGDISGLPEVSYGGQGGFGDIVLHPNFSRNRLLYMSYAEAGPGDTSGAAVARARLELDENGGELVDLEVIWRQVPKVSGQGHFGHRIVFGPNGYLWISSGERQKFDPAQDMESNLGKVIRLNEDGSVPDDNPFPYGEVTSEIWSLGHRNPLGMGFDQDGRLWDVEMGPSGGDELNLVRRGSNYGYPEVSNGDHYSGLPMPDHDTRPEFSPPAITWTPVISPSSMLFYDGDMFPQWRGDAFIGGLSSMALIRVDFNGDTAWEAERFEMNRRIRDVEQGPDGALWLIEGGRRGAEGHLLKLTAPD